MAKKRLSASSDGQSSTQTSATLPLMPSGSVEKTKSRGMLMVRATVQMRITEKRYCRLDMVPVSGKEIAAHLSREIAIKVLTDADTDTPCKYETILQTKTPKIQAKIDKVAYQKIFFKK